MTDARIAAETVRYLRRVTPHGHDDADRLLWLIRMYERWACVIPEHDRPDLTGGER